MYIIVEGSIKVYQMDDDRKQIVTGILHAGDHVGEMSLIDRKPRSAWLAAREPSTLLVLHYSNFNDMLEKSHAFCLSIMGALTERLRSANLKTQSLALMAVYGRVAQLLNGNVGRTRRPTPSVRTNHLPRRSRPSGLHPRNGQQSTPQSRQRRLYRLQQ
jgi:CRP-like cAMP-binding protein